MKISHISRRVVVAAAVSLATPMAMAQAPAKLKVGFMLPATGTFAALGTAIENGFMLYVNEQGGKIGGREVEFFKVDDESDPSKAIDNVNKLIKRDNVDVLVGSVHSGVAMAMANVAKRSGTLMINPNGGADAVTGAAAGAGMPPEPMPAMLSAIIPISTCGSPRPSCRPRNSSSLASMSWP